jgi:hypothetical protein
MDATGGISKSNSEAGTQVRKAGQSSQGNQETVTGDSSTEYWSRPIRVEATQLVPSLWVDPEECSRILECQLRQRRVGLLNLLPVIENKHVQFRPNRIKTQSPLNRSKQL